MSHGLTTDCPVTREGLLRRRGLPAHVVGATSAEGVAVARLLDRLGFSQVVLHDMRPRAGLRKGFRTTHGAYTRVEQDEIWASLRPLLDAGRYDEEYLAGIQGPCTVVLGQGWYLVEGNRRAVREAVLSAGDDVLVTSMTALYFALVPGPIAGITGTNGKSTTVALVEHLLAAAGVDHRSAGNERSSRQFLPDVDELDPAQWALLEVSNRQLMQVQRSPQVAAITALTPDHLEEHEAGFDGYRATKARLFRWQREDDVAIANADDPHALEAAASGAGTLVACGIAEPGVEPPAGASVRWEGDELVVRHLPVHEAAAARPDGGMLGSTADGDGLVVATRDDLALRGLHNQRNAAVAVALSLACGASPASIAPALASFSGKGLRQEHVGTVGGVDVYSDIKSTTPESAIAALDALVQQRRAVLVCGGEDKGLDYRPLAEAIAGHGVHVVALRPGSATDVLVRELGRLGVEVRGATALDEALDAALELAGADGAVIVSPAAAGFWTSWLQGGPSLRALVQRRQDGAVPASAHSQLEAR